MNSKRHTHATWLSHPTFKSTTTQCKESHRSTTNMQKDTQAVESSEYKKQQSWIRRKFQTQLKPANIKNDKKQQTKIHAFSTRPLIKLTQTHEHTEKHTRTHTDTHTHTATHTNTHTHKHTHTHTLGLTDDDNLFKTGIASIELCLGENTERKHTDRKHTNRRHREKTQTQNTERKHRENTQTENTQRENTERTHRERKHR